MSSLKCIAYSVFGTDKDSGSGITRNGYLRQLSLNIKISELIYPGWRIYIAIDQPTYDEFKEMWDLYTSTERIEIEVLPRVELCKMMIWRMRPIFTGKYQYVICRDTDSLLHYREHQAVNNYILNGRSVHSITDSVSHDVPLLGGMIGFKNPQFLRLIHCDTWEQMIAKAPGHDWNVKGSDQTFLRDYIVPMVHNDMVEHYVEGMKHSVADYKSRGAYYDHIQNDDIEGVREEMRESNDLVEHIGQAGFPVEHTKAFIKKYMNNDRMEWYRKIEEKFPEIHYVNE